MQPNHRFTYLFLMSFIFMIACIKPVDDNLLITDPVKWNNHAIWIEDKMYFGMEDTINIQNGNELEIWWNEFQESNMPKKVGEFKYNPKYSLNIDTSGFFKMYEDLLILIKKPVGSTHTDDTMTVLKYTIDQNQLIIRDTSVMPVLEYYYRKKQ